jgi:predicted metal-dependent peptidase
MKLPEGALMPSADQADQAAESIYSTLMRDQQQEQEEGGDDQQGGGQDQNGASMGETRKPEADDAQGDGEGQGEGDGSEGQGGAQGAEAAPVDIEQLEHEWQMATVQAAAMAKSRGSLPGGIQEAIEAANQARIDWATELRRFMQQAAKDDYTWRRPNARYQARGLYMPALNSEAMGPVVVAVDTSASVSSAEVSAFMAEVANVIADCSPNTRC